VVLRLPRPLHKNSKKKDKYFKIFIGESGKWLDFDPPSSRVEMEMSSNKDHQKILDAQRTQRMNKINVLAGKHKEMLDKKDKGKSERITEAKKAGAASDAVEKQRAKKQKQEQENTQDESKQEKKVAPTKSRAAALEKTKERMRKRLADTKNKQELDRLAKEDRGNVETIKIDEKIKVVHKATSELEEKKTMLDEADKNIEHIKQILARKKAATQNS